MKIAHLISHTGLNGVATSTKTLIDQQILAGHEVMLVYPRKSWIGKQSFAGPIKMLESSFKTLPADLRETGYPILDWRRTLIHTHGSRANKFGMIYAIVDGVPTVMTAHARQFQIPWRFAHAVVGLSQQTADYYTRRLLVSPRRMHIVPNMFDAGALSPVSDQARSNARRELGIRDEAFLLGSVGMVGKRKRQIDMVRILGKLVAAGIDAELLLIGGLEDEQMPGWEEAIADPALRGRIHLPGQRSDAVALVPAMDVFLCTSVREEAPIAPLEAMAQAIPVISTDVGNMADLLPKDRIFAIGDIDGLAGAAELLARNPELRASDGSVDRSTVTGKLAPGIILPQIEDIYRAAIKQAGPRGYKNLKQLAAKS
ncbi:glycosyltransferase family 4 protein [Pseudaminobacter soli (ex Li et al. 2025)]|uniref:Group 1 glycosyl transferase n=1 Tax=Pseudaminobacter soli (ex Li et al. 2025) TaxID=1295366 RepID=A0A2P7S759_9HYPH|nr:glycosyltransferase family 4 protein [Mesorhizobium soli]PSJ58308.1 group 1 glycosyl transferase [Mesorhizobium soli]